MSNLRSVVSCDLTFAVLDRAEIILQIAPASSVGNLVDETFELDLNGAAIPITNHLMGPHDSRIHIVDSETGTLNVRYRAEIEVGARSVQSPLPSEDFDQIMYERPSRYCPSDHLVGFAVSEFGMDSDVAERVQAITAWIRRRIVYASGSGSVHDSAEDTLLTCTGTCRDFAHLGVALCRSVGIAARFTAVYAPGLFPMDFHAVFEAFEHGRWCVHDATGLAPRQDMIRIVTGRDAADTAFAAITRGNADLIGMEVTATSGSLSTDDHVCVVEMA